MQDELHNKLAHLKEYIKDLGSVAIAFSSGVDFTFLYEIYAASKNKSDKDRK